MNEPLHKKQMKYSRLKINVKTSKIYNSCQIKLHRFTLYQAEDTLKHFFLKINNSASLGKQIFSKQYLVVYNMMMNK